MKKKNFLLGKGERLAESVVVRTRGGDKDSPYSFQEAKERLTPMLENVVAEMDKLPDDACPEGYTIATITLNPEYIAKSYYPGELLRSVGLTAVGSRSRQMIPAKKSLERVPTETKTTELYVLGKKESFRKWAKELSSWIGIEVGAQQIVEIEEITFPQAASKVKSVDPAASKIVYEIVLHQNEDKSESGFLAQFQNYLKKRNIEAKFEKRFYAGGLCFLELEAAPEQAEEIAQYSFVRALRKMPTLRLLRPAIRNAKKGNSSQITLPDFNPIDVTSKVAIFDGGIPDGHPICKWVTPYEFSDLRPGKPGLFEHGVGVTSAFLFGHINPGSPLPQPYSYVDHYRVLDDDPGLNPYELFEVLDRIQSVLTTKKYNFINLSLGPTLPIEDDEIHVWTAVLDEYLADGTTLATIAVGNDGEADPYIRANRVQVPADCVNALGIGSCDVPDANWQRASYSSIGPGRSPGLVKPDLVDFGGSLQRPFLTLDWEDGRRLIGTGGTSFSAPSVLRLGAGVRAHFGDSLNALAIRTLLVHCSEDADLPKVEVGWGRVARELQDIVICEDHEIRVVFQGKITASKFIRVPIPVPSGSLKGMVKVKATLCYTTPVDPHHPDNYTRSGLEVTYRPNKDKRNKPKPGEPVSVHAASKSFFGKTQKKFQTEEERRRDAWKWENCIHAENRFRGGSLNEPIFDIHYNARAEGHNDSNNQELNYALVITIQAPKVANLYDQVLRRYATILEQIQPIIEIPIKV